jgi:hypothetical protein
MGPISVPSSGECDGPANDQGRCRDWRAARVPVSQSKILSKEEFYQKKQDGTKRNPPRFAEVLAVANAFSLRR